MSYLMYLPDGTETDCLNEFITVYSNKYFQDYPQNNRGIEEKIIKITEKAINIEPADVITLMRWKTGNRKNDGYISDCYGNRISLDIGEKVIDAVNLDVEQSDMGIYQALLCQEMEGLGVVYLLTLVWAISGMKYPIYDKFAKVAISSICKGVKPNVIEYKKPPEKSQVKLVKDMYNNYQEQLTDVFGLEWKTRREIDQALWAYGHQKFKEDSV